MIWFSGDTERPFSFVYLVAVPTLFKNITSLDDYRTTEVCSLVPKVIVIFARRTILTFFLYIKKLLF